ncbi:MAG: beta-lactamase family protein [Bacteroidales bacterium]|nr:beta-lactamase family protein [Bacteroidales bacterium]
MNIKPLFLLFVLCCATIFISCKKDKNNTEEKNMKASLQIVADSVYQVFNEKWDIDKAGVLIYVNGSSGTYMVSSNITPEASPESHFRVASISKTFTAAAIMLLQQEGKLNIDDSIVKYLPNTAAYDIPYRNEITIKQLIQHRAGVFDVTNNNIPETIDAPYAGIKYEDYIRQQDNLHTFTFEELVGLNAQHQISTAVPDVGFNYSNTGYNLLGKIIEEVSGLSYSEFISQRFTQPLGLTDTYSVWQGSDITMRTPFIDSYLYIKGLEAIPTAEDNMSVHVTEGDIVSTPKDITTWMRLLLTGESGVNAANVDLMKEMLPADGNHGVYGLGLVYEEGLGYGHNGAHLSYVSTLRYNPENGITVLASANFIRIDTTETGMQSFLELGFGIRDACYSAVDAYKK